MGIFDWIGNQSRAIQWAIYAAVFLVVYLVAIDPAMSATSELRSQAASLESRNETYARTLAEREGRAGSAALASVRHGAANRLPTSDEAGTAIPNLFAELEEEFRLSGWRIDPRITTLSDASLKDRFAPGPNQVIQRLIYRLTFETSTDTARDFLAALEAADEVTAVSVVSWRSGGNLRAGNVSVQLEAETWAIGERSRRR
jgi:hypothetical protein